MKTDPVARPPQADHRPGKIYGATRSRKVHPPLSREKSRLSSKVGPSVPNVMSIAYAAEVGNYTLLLDDTGICIRVDLGRGSSDPGETDKQEQYLGAQFVAALDVTVPGGLLPLPQVGAQLLLGRITDGRIALLRTRPVTRFVDYAQRVPPPPPSQRVLQEARPFANASRLPPPMPPPPARRPSIPSVPPNPYVGAPEIRHSSPPPPPPDSLRSQVFTLAQLATKDERRPLPTTPPHKRPTIAPRSDRPPPLKNDE